MCVRGMAGRELRHEEREEGARLRHKEELSRKVSRGGGGEPGGLSHG